MASMKAQPSTSSASQQNSVKKIILSLTELAIFRGARMDKMALSLYAKRLAEENADDVCKALEALRERPAHDKGRMMPDMGIILEAVNAQRKVRLAQASIAAEERLIRWRCPVCHVTMSGFVKPGASKLRYCRGLPQKAHYGPGEVCGGSMDVVEDFPAKLASQGMFHG